MKLISLTILLVYLLSPSLFAQQDPLVYKYRQMAVDYQQAVKMANKNIEGADALVDAAKAGFLPKFDVGGNYNYLGVPIQLGSTDGTTAGSELQNMYELELRVSQPIITGGYLKNTKNIALARSSAANNYLGLSKQNTMLESDAYYLTVVTKKEISLLAEEYLEAILQFQKVIQDRVDEEVVGLNELYQAKVRSNDAQYEVIRVNKELQVSLMELNRLIGVPLETQTEHMDSLMVVSINGSVDNQVEDALKKRPEMGLRENELLINQHNEKITASFYNPQLNVGAGVSYGAPSPGLQQDPAGNYGIYATLAVPIFYWGQKNDEVFAKQKITEQTQLEIERTTDIIKFQVLSGYYEFQRSKEQVDFAFGALDNAEKNVDVMLDRYNEGLSSVLEVLDAQLSWEKSYLNYIESKFELNIAHSTYQKAIGELSISQ